MLGKPESLMQPFTWTTKTVCFLYMFPLRGIFIPVIIFLIPKHDLEIWFESRFLLYLILDEKHVTPLVWTQVSPDHRFHCGRISAQTKVSPLCSVWPCSVTLRQLAIVLSTCIYKHQIIYTNNIPGINQSWCDLDHEKTLNISSEYGLLPTS
jgi:hypothetical protein